MSAKMVGRPLRGERAATRSIGIELARNLGLTVGDKLRVSTPDERAEVFTVRGLFDVGNKDVNERWVFVPLRSAQTLLDLAGGVSTIEVRVDGHLRGRGDRAAARRAAPGSRPTAG